MNHQFRNVAYLADLSGTGRWRFIFQNNAVECISQKLNINNTYSQYPVLDVNYYKGITSITVQRWINDSQRKMFCDFFKPICDANGAWILYNIDDCMHFDEIPLYNRGRRAFEDPQTQANIKEMLNTSDLVVVTTDRIKKYYHEKYEVPLENILAVPNLLPRWWFDDKYDSDKSVEDFKKFKAKPRIGIVSSLSHYNVDGIRMTEDGKAVRLRDKEDIDKRIAKGETINIEECVWIDQNNNEVKYSETTEIKDDLDEIADLIRRTVDDFQWVMFGFNPPQLKDLYEKKKIEFHPGVAILNYPAMLKKLRLQAVIAPIKSTTFNHCKSPIKFMECSAIGVPLFASNCPPYSDYMENTRYLFNNQDELEEKLKHLKFQTSPGAYRNIIEENWKWLNSPHQDADFKLKNYWLEDNLGIWIDLFRLRNKGLTINLSSFIPQYEAKKKQEAEGSIYKSEDGEVEITR